MSVSTPRRERFRALRERLDATRPETAVEGGWIVEDPRFTMAERLWRDFELEPSRCVQLVGGVGSGKTTQLRLVEKRLRNANSTLALPVDCGGIPRASGDCSGWLVARFAEELLRRVPSLLPIIDNLDSQLMSAELLSDEEKLDRIKDYFAKLRARLDLIRSDDFPLTLILLVDGLDRVHDLELRNDLLRTDIPMLREAGFGVLMTASIEQATSAHSSMMSTHVQPTVSPEREGLEFLSKVLQVRDEQGILTNAAREALGVASGGVLRDLIQLAHRSTDVAYFHGSDSVEVEHVEQATREFAQQQLFSVSDEELVALQDLARGKPFQLAGEKNIRLVTDRLVLDYGEARPARRFALHPALRPFFDTKAA